MVPRLARDSCRTLAIALPDIPIEAFKTCVAGGSFRLEISPHAIAVVFGELFSSLVATTSRSRRLVSDVSAFGAIIHFVYSNVETVRFSSLLRTIVADATVYFIMATGLQTLVLFFLSLADVRIVLCPSSCF